MTSIRRSASPSNNSDNNNNNTGGDGNNNNNHNGAELDENGNPIINANATPDFEVQLFLEAAGRACVYMENWLRERARMLKERQFSDHDQEAFQQSRVSEVVQVFRQDRPKMESEVRTLRAEKAGIEKSIQEDLTQHQEKMRKDKEEYQRNLDALESEIAHLTKDAKEAEDWINVQGPPARSQLQQLLARIEEIQMTTENKVKSMDSDHEECKRDMRESLVLRLRAVRDAAAADAASAGGGGGTDGGGGDGGDGDDSTGADEETAAALVGKPTTKTNERLTREVAVYVRESLALEHSLSNLKTQEAALSSELATKQNANEKLVLQNAASAKTKKILESKLKELEGQLSQVEQDADRRFTERANSLVETSSQQSMIINELNDEIDLEIEKLLKLKAEYREAQQQRLMQKRRARAASRFFLNCNSDFQQQETITTTTTAAANGSSSSSALVATTTTTTRTGNQEEDATMLTSSSPSSSAQPHQQLIMFLPTNGAVADHGAMVSQLGKVKGRKEASQILMRLMQRE